MKILLVKPRAALDTINRLRSFISFEPLELGYLAAAVPEGHTTRVLDLRLTTKPDRVFRKELMEYKPDIVGISGYTHEVSKVLDLAKIVRKVLNRALVIVGGHHATVLPNDYNKDYIDAIVRGEGCAPFRAIVEHAAAGKNLFGIQNVMVPGEKFDDAGVSRMPQFPDPSDIPAPRRDLWDMDRYRSIWVKEGHTNWETIFPPVALVRTSYGCVMTCTFCVVPTLYGKRHMTRPPDKVAEEIENINAGHIYFCDDETFMNTTHIRKVAEAIEARGIKKRYFAWARSTTVNNKPELFRLWRRIGLDGVFLGFEATSDQELKDLSKHATVSDNERAHKLLREMGIAVHAGFMVNPEFSELDFERLQSYVRGMPPAQVTFTVFTPSPGSPAWFEEKDKFVGNPFSLHDCMHPLIQTKMPLRQFYRHFASLVSEGGNKNPLRSTGNRLPPLDIVRVLYASYTYSKCLRKAYRDYPRNLW